MLNRYVRYIEAALIICHYIVAYGRHVQLHSTFIWWATNISIVLLHIQE